MSWWRSLRINARLLWKGRVLRYEEPSGLKNVPHGTQIWHEGLSVLSEWRASPSS